MKQFFSRLCLFSLLLFAIPVFAQTSSVYVDWINGSLPTPPSTMDLDDPKKDGDIYQASEFNALVKTLYEMSNDDGNVGLGTKSPTHRIDVAGQARVRSLTTSPVCADAQGVLQDCDQMLSCQNGEILKWNGSSWSCDSDLTGSGSGSLPNCNTQNQILKWNGSAWTCAADNALDEATLNGTTLRLTLKDGTVVNIDLSSLSGDGLWTELPSGNMYNTSQRAVGIGTTAPLHQLHVGGVGDAYIHKSLAIGPFSQAAGERSLATGGGEATGFYSVAHGPGSKSIGEKSFAQGENSEAREMNSVAIGEGTKAIGKNSFVLGRGGLNNKQDSILLSTAASPQGKPNERKDFFIAPNGYVGIGNDNPSGDLTVGASHLEGDIIAYGYVPEVAIVHSGKTQNGAPIQNGNATVQFSNLGVGNEASWDIGLWGDDRSFRFSSHWDLRYNPVMILTRYTDGGVLSGRLGLGTLSPTHKIDVNGYARIRHMNRVHSPLVVAKPYASGETGGVLHKLPMPSTGKGGYVCVDRNGNAYVHPTECDPDYVIPNTNIDIDFDNPNEDIDFINDQFLNTAPFNINQ